MKYVALLVSVILIGIDQLTKWLITENMMLNEKIKIIGIGDFELLNFIRIQPNEGAAFGILQGKQGFLITITSVFLVAIIIYMFTKYPKGKLTIWALSLIIAGGIGNLIDRVLYGEVTDFIQAFFMKNTIFNFADICAVIGSIILIVTIFLDEIVLHKNRKTQKEEVLLEQNQNTDDL